MIHPYPVEEEEQSMMAEEYSKTTHEGPSEALDVDDHAD